MLSVEELSAAGPTLIGRLGPSGDWTTPVGPRTWPNLPHPRLIARAVTQPLCLRPEAVLGVTFPDGRVPTESWADALRPITGDDLASRPALDLHRPHRRRPPGRPRPRGCAGDRPRHCGRGLRRDPRLLPAGRDRRPPLRRRWRATRRRTRTSCATRTSISCSCRRRCPPRATGRCCRRSGPFRRHFRLRLAQEVRKLQRRGIPVVVFQPSASDQEVMGGKAMDSERNAAVVRAARETTRRRLEHGRHADRLAVLAA